MERSSTRNTRLIILALVALIGACSGDETAAGDGGGNGLGVDAGTVPNDRLEPTPEVGWGEVFGPDDRGLLLSVWGTADDDVYFVGGTSEATTILHWDGTRVQSLSNPGDRLAWWVFGVDDDLYISGERGLLLHRAAGSTTFEDISLTTSETLYGLWGTATDDLWTVGGSFPDGEGVLFHHEGGEWSSVLLPDAVPDLNALFKVWGSAADDVHVIGESGTALHLEDGEWALLETPSDEDLLTIHGRAADDVWAVGGRGTGVVWFFDGDAWVETTPGEAESALNGVFVGADTAAELVGSFGLQISYDGLEWFEESTASAEVLHAVWCSDESCWAVGGNLFNYPNDPHGVIMRRAPPRPLQMPVGGCNVPTRCGDGNITCDEVCDDGNAQNGDYCSSDCMQETGYCGDGELQMGAELCDDGNNDACVGNCAADCSGTPNRCGDGVERCGEACDDGNVDVHDACPDGTDGTCEAARCGDGYRWLGTEDCDALDLGMADCTLFGHESPVGLQCDDECHFDSSRCGLSDCGNGEPEFGEDCDDGNRSNDDACPDGVAGTCKPAFCGDGFVRQGIETCDILGAPACGADCNPSCDGPGQPCAGGCVSGVGTHRLFLQGRNGRPDCLGRYPMYVDEEDLVHGEHYLLGEGAFVEFAFQLCADITDEIRFYIPNNDFEGSEALHEVRIRRAGQDDIIIASSVDTQAGNFGYNPFEANPENASEENLYQAIDIDVQQGDELIVRSTNQNDVMFSVMIFSPPSEYESWVEVVVPEGSPTFEGPSEIACPMPDCDGSATLDVGMGAEAFEALDAMNHMAYEVGPQGSLMFRLAVRGTGFEPGNQGDRDSWPRVDMQLHNQDDSLVGFLSQDVPFATDGEWLIATNLILSIDPDTIGASLKEGPHNLTITVTDIGGTAACLEVEVQPTD